MRLDVKAFTYSWFSLWVVIALIGIYFLYPLRKTLRLGIDLVGGTYITLQVHTDKAVEAALLEHMQTLANRLEVGLKIAPLSRNVEKGKLIFTFDSVAMAQDAAHYLRDTNLVQKVEGPTIEFTLSEKRATQLKEEAVIRNIEVLRNRLDKLSVAEISIVRQGKDEVVIELPDVSNPQQAKAMIGQAAVLEFRPVIGVAHTEEELRMRFDGQVPGDLEILPGKEQYGRISEYYLVPRYAEVSGKYLTDARPRFDDSKAEMVVEFWLSSEGGSKFYDLTTQYYQQPLAIVLDKVVLSAPIIQGRIRDTGFISGGFNSATAKELAILLKSGSFVAPVSFEEERQIGPSLGMQAIKQGVIACLVGLVLLFIFSVAFYKFSGLLAFVALLFNMLLVLLGLVWLRATLTLPGIAGMILTVGMAIDASILIFERIKESLASGVSTKQAVEIGFSDAMAVILDANITTLVVGIVLYKFGTGPIQGFAVTMILGIFATLIAGLFFLRALFNAFIDGFNIKRLSI